MLGVSPEIARRMTRELGIKASVVPVSPPIAIALGMPRARLLHRETLPGLRALQVRVTLVALWAVVAMTSLVTIASFIVSEWAAYRLRGILVTAGVAGIAGGWTAYASWRLRRSDPNALRGMLETRFPWDVVLIGGGEAALAALFVALMFLLVTFVVFVVWLPVLFVILNVVTLGELWKTYRTVFIEIPEPDAAAVGRLGRQLLHNGAALSGSWDVHLGPDVPVAQAARRELSEFHVRFLAVGISSLGMAAAVFLSEIQPSNVWFRAGLVAAGLATGFSIILLAHRSLSRRKRRRIAS